MPYNPVFVDKDALGQKGRDLNRTVSENALDFDISTIGAGAVAAHIADPVGAHKASAISTADADDYFVSDEVEGVTQEIGETLDRGRQDGVMSGTSITSVGLDVTLSGGSRVRIAGNIRNYASESLTLPPNTLTYLYIDKATRSFAQSATPPDLNDGVLLWGVTTGPGTVLSSTDYRYHVSNSDRKDVYTVTASFSGAARGEANFRSLQAAINFLTIYANGFVASTTSFLRILIRGDNTVDAAIPLPSYLEGLIIEGDGRNAILRTGGSLVGLIQVNGTNRLTLRNLNFVCDHTGSTAILATVGFTGDDLVVEKCRFISGTQDWQGGVVNTDTAITYRTIVRDCFFVTSRNAVQIDKPTECVVDNCSFEAAGSSSTYTAISLGLLGGSIPAFGGKNLVENNRVLGYDTGIFLTTNLSNVFGNTVAEAEFCVDINGGQTLVISGNTLANGSSNGHIGIRVDACPYCRITDNWVSNNRTVFAGETPRGIQLLAGSDDANISGNNILNYRNDGGSNGSGIEIANFVDKVRIVNCGIRLCYTGIYAFVAEDVQISNCQIEGAARGIFSFSAGVSIVGTIVDLSSTDGLYGIYLAGTSNLVNSCHITNPRTVYNPTDTPQGIVSVNTGDDTHITNTIIDGFLNPSTIYGIGLVLGGDNLTVEGGRVTNCTVGIQADGSTRVVISNVRIDNCVEEGIRVSKDVSPLKIKGCELLDPGSDYGISVFGCEDLIIEGNTIECNFATDTAIYVAGDTTDQCSRFVISGNVLHEATNHSLHLYGYVQRGQVTNNHIDGYAGHATNTDCIGIHLETDGTDTPEGVVVTSNTIQRCWGGIICEGDPSAPMNHCAINSNEIEYIANDQVNYSAETFDEMGSHGIGLLWTYRTIVSANVISNVGRLRNDDGSVFQPGSNVGSNGIFAENCQVLKVEQNLIRAGRENGTGDGFGVRLIWWNHGGSENWEKYTLSNNTITFIPGPGIYISSAPGTISPATGNIVSQVVVSNNTIEDLSAFAAVFEETGVYFEAGDFGTFEQTTIADNSIRQTDKAGIQVKADDGGQTITHLSITGNTIFDVNNNSASHGIWLNIIGLTVTQVSDITVSDNTVDSNDATATLIRLESGVTMERVVVTGNQLHNGLAGIAIEGELTDAELHDLVVNDNQITNYSAEGIKVDCLSDYMSDVMIAGNTLNTTLGTHGIYVQSGSALDRSLGITVTDNVVFGPPNQIWLDFKFARDIIVAGNSLRGNSAHASYDDTNGIQLLTESDLSPQLENVKISGNALRQCRKYGIQVVATGLGNTNGLEIVDNSLDSCAVSNTSWAAIELVPGGSLLSSRIDGNTIRESNTSGTSAAAIDVYPGNTSIDLKRFSISRNILSLNDGHGIRVHYDGSNSFGEVNDVTLSHNVVYGSELNGINPAFGDGVTTSVLDLKVDGNSVTNATQYGILLNLATADGAENKNISVCSNTVSKVSGAAEIGIYINQSRSATDHDLYGLSVCNNVVENIDVTGVWILTSGQSTGSSHFEGIVFNSNIVRECGDETVVSTTQSFTGGCFFVLRGDTQHITVSNNQFIDNARFGFAIHLGEAAEPFAGTIAGIGNALMAQGNIARGGKGGGTAGGRVGIGGTTSWVNGVIVDNIHQTGSSSTVNTPYGAGTADMTVSWWQILEGSSTFIINSPNGQII